MAQGLLPSKRGRGTKHPKWRHCEGTRGACGALFVIVVSVQRCESAWSFSGFHQEGERLKALPCLGSLFVLASELGAVPSMVEGVQFSCSLG